MQLLTMAEGKCKVVIKEEPSSIPALRAAGLWVGPGQQLDLDLRLATAGGATVRQAPWEGPAPSRLCVP